MADTMAGEKKRNAERTLDSQVFLIIVISKISCLYLQLE